MRYFLTATTVALTVALTACSSSGPDRAYMRGGRSLPRLQDTQSIHLIRKRDAYAVPTNPNNKELKSAPSVVPPGQGLETSHNSGSVDSAQQHLVLNKPLDASWTALAKILPKTAYPIMDRDREMHAFFLVDKSSSKRITKTSPIYQLTLTPAGQKTSLTLLDSDSRPATPAVTARLFQIIKQGVTS